MKIIFLFLTFFYIHISYSQNYVIKKIEINIDNKIDGICPVYDQYTGMLLIGGISLDKNLNVYVVDFGDSSIKKFDNSGKFLGKTKTKGISFGNVYYYNNKIFSLNQLNRKNDLYIFNSNTLELLSYKTHIYESRTGDQPCFFQDGLLVIDQLDRFHVYDLRKLKMVYNLKSPFNYCMYRDLSEQELEFLMNRQQLNSNPSYIGRITNYFLFFKEDYSVDDKFNLALINVDENSILKSTFSVKRNKDIYGIVFHDQVGLLKSHGYFYILGFEDGKMVINLIDLKKLFPMVKISQQ